MATDIPPSQNDSTEITPRTPSKPKGVLKNNLKQEEEGDRLVKGTLKKVDPLNFDTRELDSREKKYQRGLAFVESLQKPIEGTPEQELKIDYLIFLQDLLKAVNEDPIAFRTDDGGDKPMVFPAWGSTPTQGARPETQDEYRGAVSSRVQGFLAKSANLTIDVMMNDRLNVVKALDNDLYWMVKELGFEKMPKDEQGLLEYRNRFVSMLREAKKYDAAEHQIEYALKDEFATHVEEMKKIPNIYAAADREASESIRKLVNQYRDTWKAQGMNDAQISDVEDNFERISRDRILRRRAFKYKEFNLSGTKAELAEQYNDMLNPKNETLNMTDKNWDLLMEAAFVNIPLVVFTGLVGMAARAGVSILAREFFLNAGEVFVGRFATQGAVESATARLITEGVMERSLGVRVLGGVAGYSVESSVASACFRIFKNQWYEGLAPFATDLILSLTLRGVINVGGVALKGGIGAPQLQAVTKTMEEAAEAIQSVPLRNAVNRLLATNNHVGAAVLITQAGQRGMVKNIRGRVMKEIFEFLGDTVEETTKVDILPKAKNLRPRTV
ncbi:hypothetical protein KBD59_06120 [Candidatus Gracilibacteria bacterium]|nr:hypothetical protein [Candidatus Gracilibacteria bacterium]